MEDLIWLAFLLILALVGFGLIGLLSDGGPGSGTPREGEEA
jgi:hypothetical protein